MTEITLLMGDQPGAGPFLTLIFFAIVATPILLIILIISVLSRRGSKDE